MNVFLRILEILMIVLFIVYTVVLSLHQYLLGMKLFIFVMIIAIIRHCILTRNEN